MHEEHDLVKRACEDDEFELIYNKPKKLTEEFTTAANVVLREDHSIELKVLRGGVYGEATGYASECAVFLV